MAASEATADSSGKPRQALSLFDSTSVIVGIIIGSAIYEITPRVVNGAGGWAVQTFAAGATADVAVPDKIDVAALCYVAVLSVWIVGGLVALLGAMCYAELATA